MLSIIRTFNSLFVVATNQSTSKHFDCLVSALSSGLSGYSGVVVSACAVWKGSCCDLILRPKCTGCASDRFFEKAERQTT